MNLKNKKALAARTLGVGKGRIIFSPSRIDEIKEILTKQDVRDLVNSGAIMIREIRGKRKSQEKGRKGPGKIKKKQKRRKENYIKLTRKLRAYVKQLKSQGRLKNEDFIQIRKKIRSKAFRSKEHLKEIMKGAKQ